ncbi:MAG: glycosyltransferase [Alphaproteobacteria bacterium]|nr:glycosyltransferase [Alphaproteobacteria bacterium]
MPEVIVAIPSFRRPQGLERLLRALEQLHTDAPVSVLVADNDADRLEARRLCERLQKQYRWPLTCIVAQERGIAQARNALVEHILTHSHAEFVAMLDDDEWPETGWLDAFLHVQRVTGADALHGAVVHAFENRPGRWAGDCHGFAPMRRRSGPIAAIEGTSNVLISRACFEALSKPCFDPAFALTGGEDRDFFERLRRQGRRFAWADDAIVHAWVPSSRARPWWALQRAYRTGNSDMRVFLKHRDSEVALVRELAKIAGATLIYLPVLLASALLVRQRMGALCKLCRAAGKTAALFGHAYNEYATVHGA